jgi:hypothetical protein
MVGDKAGIFSSIGIEGFPVRKAGASKQQAMDRVKPVLSETKEPVLSGRVRPAEAARLCTGAKSRTFAARKGIRCPPIWW